MEQRPLTARERQALDRVPSPKSPFHLAWDTGMGSFGASGCLGGMLILAIAAFCGMYDVSRRVTVTVLQVVVGLAVVTGAVSTAMRYSIARRKDLHRQSQIDADLAGGVASVERHRATAALRTIMPEHQERAYFMRLADGRVMFIGYWAMNDPDVEIPGLPNDLPTYPSSEFEIARGPASGLILGVTFLGEPLAVSDTFEHAEALRKPRLGVGAIAPESWEEIRKAYS